MLSWHFVKKLNEIIAMEMRDICIQAHSDKIHLPWASNALYLTCYIWLVNDLAQWLPGVSTGCLVTARLQEDTVPV